MSHQPEILSLEALYEKYKNQIYTLCIRLTLNKDSAEDLFCDTWAKVAEKYGHINHEKNQMNWIYTVCLNIYRKSVSRRKPLTFFDDYTEMMLIKSDDADAESALAEQETSAQLQKALANLKDKYRVPVTLFYFKDLSYNDIASIMNIPLSTVKFRLNQAKVLLRKEMEAYLEPR